MAGLPPRVLWGPKRSAGNLKLGAWGHTGTFTRFNGGHQIGTQGYYAIFNQTIWQPVGEPGDGRGLRSFLGYGRTLRTVSVIDWAAAGGLAWKGLFSARPNDMAGLGPAYARVSRDAGLPRSYELATELFYLWQINRWATVMPDLQYIVNPGGRYANALVASLRLVLILEAPGEE